MLKCKIRVKISQKNVKYVGFEWVLSTTFVLDRACKKGAIVSCILRKI